VTDPLYAFDLEIETTLRRLRKARNLIVNNSRSSDSVINSNQLCIDNSVASSNIFTKPGQMENNDRTLKELSGLIHLLPKFHGLTGEEPHKHLKEFHVHNGETLHEYWERFNNLCATCPHHQISETLLIQYFYEGLSMMGRSMIDTARVILVNCMLMIHK
ncbi:hypothetical protein CR513_35204, partial [Mucuna pruriens]